MTYKLVDTFDQCNKNVDKAFRDEILLMLFERPENICTKIDITWKFSK